MAFLYYQKLNVAQKLVYRKSDEITSMPLPDALELQPLIAKLEQVIIHEDRTKIEDICLKISSGILERYALLPIGVRVLTVRPAGNWGELHGLYETAEGRNSAIITVWMRTVKYKRVVAVRSFLRTLLHELCHHLDYELRELPRPYGRGFLVQ